MFKMTDKDGNLIVLRPDMTLSCARIAATKLHEDRARLCYFSNIYNFAAGGNSDREVAQAGVEIFGEEGAQSDADTVAFAVECLKSVGLKNFIVDIGHVGFYKGLLEDSGLSAEAAEEIRGYINAKDAVNTEIALRRYGASEKAQSAILALPSLFGGAEVLERAKTLTENPAALAALAHLQEVYALFVQTGRGKIRLLRPRHGQKPFLLFGHGLYGSCGRGGRSRAFGRQVRRIVRTVRAQSFRRRVRRRIGARAARTGVRGGERLMLNVALAKGRLAESCADLFIRCGIRAEVLKEETRKLVLETPDKKFRFFFVKPSDVPTYVEYGIADIGIVGKDTLLEAGADLYEMLDLKFEKCRLCLAGFPDRNSLSAPHLRVATKYVNTAKKLFLSRGEDVEIIKLNGSIELAPLTGLSDVIFDIVQSGGTLRANGLVVLEEIFDISARLVANKVSLKTKAAQILPLISEMKKYIGE